jgi:hypothetical protein
MFDWDLRKEVIKVFGYVKESRILDIIERERRKVDSDMDLLYEKRKRHIETETDEEETEYLCELASLKGKYDTLVRLTILIMKDSLLN